PRPVSRWVAQRVRGLIEAPLQELPRGLGQRWASASPHPIPKPVGIVVRVEALDPVVYRLPRDADLRRDFGEWCASIQGEQRQDALRLAGVLHVLQLRAKPPPLPRCQPKAVHVPPESTL